VYSPKLIHSKLDAIQNQISLRPKELQHNLTYYSIEQSRYYVDHLLQAVNPEYLKLINKNNGIEPKEEMFLRPLLQDELNFIENERILSANDFSYWSSHYVYIESKGLIDELSTICLFDLNIAQKMLLQTVASLEEKLIAIIVQILKARQLGSTTLFTMLICHRITYHTYEKALVGSSDPDKTSEMTDKMRFAWEHLPPWMKPIMKMSMATKEEIWVDIPSLNNKVIRQHGTQLSGIGRGNTPTIFMLSELPDFSHPEEDIDASLLPAVHDNPKTLGALESTAKGDQGYWPKTWRYNIRNWSKGKSDMCPIFLPAFVGTDLYPTKTWSRKHPIPSDWKPKPGTIAYKARSEYYVAHDSLLLSLLGENYQVPIEHLYWYELKYAEAEEKKMLNKFKEEFAGTPEDAFQHSGHSIFTLEQIDEMKNRAKPLALYEGKPAVFSLIGTDINAEYEPDIRDIDTSRPPIEIISNLGYGEKAVYRLIPLIYDSAMLDVFSEAFDNRIFIWEFPFQLFDLEKKKLFQRPFTQEYGLGNDNSEGLGLNKTSIEVIRKGSIHEYSEQVLEFASRWISANELPPWIDALGTYYSYYNDDIFNQCKIIIEIATGGAGLQHRLMVDRGWGNMHHWEGAMDTPLRRKMHRASKLGWETNRWTRPWIVGDVVRDVKDGYLRINSPHFIRECQTLQKEEDESKIQALGSDTDDLFFGGGMAHFSLSVWEIRKRIDSKYSTPLAPTLNDSFNVVEKTRKEIGRVPHYIMNTTLPTLD